MSLRLRAVLPDDLPLWSDDTEYEDYGPPVPRVEVPSARLDRDGHLGIEVDGDLIGTVGWRWVAYGPNDPSRCPMLGVYIAGPHRGKGYGFQAQKFATDLLFRHTLVNRVEASTDVTNLPEQKVLERLGFTREGIMRGSQFRSGRFNDMVMYSLLREEWHRD